MSETKQDLTPQEIIVEHAAEKAKALEQVYKCKVHPLVFRVDEDGTDYCVGYMKDPPRLTKMRVLDKSLMSPMTAAEEMLTSCLIVDESDPRILSENPEYDSIHIGAVMVASSLIKYLTNQFKKK